MIDFILRFSLKHRMTVVLFAAALLGYGVWVIQKLPIDVFPDLNRPVVTVIAESHGLAPEEVETLVTIPIEASLNGTPGVNRIRSSSGIGISIIYVEFDWGTDPFKNRQYVTERLSLVRDRLPEEVSPQLAPITSVMGEIQFVGLTSPNAELDPMELRSLADWTVRPRIMTISGISQVVVMGGQVKQYQVLASPEKLSNRALTLNDLKQALKNMSANTTGGFVDISPREFLVRPLGRVESIEDIGNSFVGFHLGRPVLVKDVAEIRIGAKDKRGEGSINGRHAVIMTIQKQPGADTIELTAKIDQELAELQKTLPAGVKIESDLFKQSRFIQSSIWNVKEALRDGSIMVAIILFLFLLNFRTTTITLLAIPLSLVITAIVFKLLGLSVNTMTLGGLAVAIGELVDDAIIDVENVFRRLKENKTLPNPKNSLRVVYEASSEVRNSIVFSTIIVVLVFVPLFALSGIEGRLFAPLGVAYIISLIASLFVSLTVTPALCSYLLPHSKGAGEHKDGWLVRQLKQRAEKILRRSLHHPYAVLSGCGVLLLIALAALPFMGRNFLPEFNEGTATIGVAAVPGIALADSDKQGTEVEKAILSVPEVKSTIRRTGRAEMDEHAEGVHWHEIDVDFKEGGRPRGDVLAEIREKIKEVGNLGVNLGQPIGHRLDHLLSGVRAQIAIKVFGPDLKELRRLGVEIQDVLKDMRGLVDLQVEQQVLVPELKIEVNRSAASQVGLQAGELTEELEWGLNGVTVSQVIEQQRFIDVSLRFDEASRQKPELIENAVIKGLPTGQSVRIRDVADVYTGTGPNLVNREDLQRRIVISANSQGRDLGSLVKEIQSTIQAKIQLPEGYAVRYGGQFESQKSASRLILLLGSISLLGIFLVLYIHFQSTALSLQVMLNVPLALIGSVAAIGITDPVLSVASLIAFITLCGIASRNGIMMISHYMHLVKEEGESFTENMVIRGSLERLVPVLMTALTACLALVPLLFAKDQPGKEILHPVAVVIVGGLISSTLLDILVTPTVFYRFGRKAVEKAMAERSGGKDRIKNQEGEF